MTKTSIATALVLSAISIPAMLSATILKGNVRDAGLNEGVPFAIVKIYSEKDSVHPIKYFSTDMDGNFLENFKQKGSYTIKVESTGKRSVSRAVSLSGETSLDLGTIDMEDDVALMNELEVVAIRPIVKASADKLSYSVEEDSDSKTYTLLDMLRKVPMVSVDGEDNITVNGSSSFKVYVNGKPSLIFSTDPSKIFKSMPASVVKSIEVVTNPGARYDAEGAGGILNLVMDQQTKNETAEGYTATIGARGGTKGFDANAYVSAQIGKFSFSVNGMHNRMYPGNTDVTTDQIFPDRVISTRTDGKPRMNFTMGNVSADYAVDSLTSIGLSASINNFSMRSTGNSFTSVNTPAGVPMLDYTSFGKMDMGRLGANGSLTFSHGFADRHDSNISIIYQLSYDKSKNDSRYDFDAPEESLINLSDSISHSPEKTLEHVVQADFSMKPLEGHTFEAGLKMSMRRAHSLSFSEFEGNLPEDNSIDYKTHNKIGAAYAEYGITHRSITGKAGVRYEYTWQDVKYNNTPGNDFSRHYGIFVPSASFSYTLTPSSNIGVTYNMRISRPGISYMNPFVNRTDPSAVSYGNPHLDVEKNHNAGISYNLFTRRLMMNVRLTDSYTGNGVERYSFYADNLLNTTYGNIVKRNNVRLDAYVNWMAGEKTRLILNGSVSYVHLKSKLLGVSNSGWQWNAMVGLQQTLPLDIKAAAYLIASSKSYTLEGWNSGFNMFSLNLSKTFLNDKLSVSAGFNTGLSKGGCLKMENVSHSSEFDTRTKTKLPMMAVTVGVSYTFGNLAPRMQQQRKSVENDYFEEKSDMESIPGMMGN